jgi:hypothetical protein
MTSEEKNERFWRLVQAAQTGPERKWKHLNEFSLWLEDWGGRIKDNKRKRKGFVVREFVAGGKRMCYEVPSEFAERCLVLDGLP